jgi:hypothetical protein
MNLPLPIESAAIAGAIGEADATEFMAFKRMYASIPNVDAILIDPDQGKIPNDPATLYALSTALASRTTDQNFARVAKYVDRMVQAGKGEFGVMTIRDAMRRNPTITQTAAFVRLATGDLGQLISGR